MVRENLLKFERNKRHVIPKNHYLCTNNQASSSMTSSSMTLCSNKSLCATCCSGKILLWRQEFKKNVWNKQKVIYPRNITYCSNMLLHLAIKCSNLLHISTKKLCVLNFSIEVVHKRSSYFTHVVGNFAWHIPFHLAHQQSSAWQYKHGLWSLNPLLFQNCHLWLWLKEQGSWLCTMHC